MQNITLNNLLKITIVIMFGFLLLLVNKFIDNMEIGRYQNAGTEGYRRILDTKTGSLYSYNYETGWREEKVVEEFRTDN